MLGSLNEGFAQRKVPFGQREIEQRQKPRMFPRRGGGAGYGTWHNLDKMTITLAIEVAKETVT